MTFETNDTICTRALQAVDPYGGGDCDSGGAESRRHVETCEACRKELETRRQLRARLKSAAGQVALPLGLETRIQAELRAAQQRPRWTFRLGTIAAAAAVCLAVGIAYQLGELRITAQSQESYISSMSGKVATFLQAGLQDHLHCAVFRKYPKNAPTLEQAMSSMDPKYAPLVPVVRKHVPEEFKVMMSHVCRYRGRKFVHIVLKSPKQLISVAVTQKRDGESVERVLPALTQSGVALYQGSAQRHEIAAFDAGTFRVYLVSDLAPQKNLQMLAAMAPEIEAMLQKLEA